jgi:hypothetical protein
MGSDQRVSEMSQTIFHQGCNHQKAHLQWPLVERLKIKKKKKKKKKTHRACGFTRVPRMDDPLDVVIRIINGRRTSIKKN